MAVNEPDRERVVEFLEEGISRFVGVNNYSENGNQLSLRQRDIERALLAVSTSQWLGQHDHELSSFVRDTADAGCDVVIDYFTGSYRKRLDPLRAVDPSNRSHSFKWFDVCRNSLLLGVVTGRRDVIELLGRWTSPDIRFDPGVDEVDQMENFILTSCIYRMNRNSFEIPTCDKISKRSQLLQAVLQEIDGEKEKYETGLQAFLSWYRKNEYLKYGAQSLSSAMGSILYHVFWETRQLSPRLDEDFDRYVLKKL